MAGPKKYRDQTNKFDDILDKDFSATKNSFKYKHTEKRWPEEKLEFEYLMKMDPATRERTTEGKFKVYYEKNEVKGTAHTNGNTTGRYSREVVDDITVGVGCDYNPWKEEQTYVAEVKYDAKPVNATVTANYGKKTGVDFVGMYKACKCFKLGASIYMDIQKQRLTTYNLLGLFKLDKARLMLEHQSVAGDSYRFGNLVVRALFKYKYRFDVAFRAILNSKLEENTFEVGGRANDYSSIDWRWKVANSGLITLGAQTTIYENDYSKLVAGLNTEVNATKRNIFEDDLNWGASLDFKTNVKD